jgi:hypothetical protein
MSSFCTPRIGRHERRFQAGSILAVVDRLLDWTYPTNSMKFKWDPKLAQHRRDAILTRAALGGKIELFSLGISKMIAL